MAPKIKAPDQLNAEPVISDRSELAGLYPDAKPINDNPISTPEEIAARKRQAYEKQVRALRRDGFRIGLYVALPYIIGLFTIQQVVMRISYIAPGDIGGAMFIVFMSFLTASSTVFLAYFLFRRAGHVFGDHYLKAWPVITTILISLVGSTPLALDLGQLVPFGWLGYLTSLAAIVLVSIVISAALIYVWTSKLDPKAKIILLAIVALIFIVLLFV